jgi:chromosome segregation ATPase
MRSPYLSALFNPLGLATLAMAVAAGLCAAWWLCPLGLIVWGIMMYGLVTDPELRRLQVMQSRASVAQRFQNLFDRIERAQASISHTVSDSHPRVRPMLEPLQGEIDALVERTYQLCTRMTVLENYRSVQSFQGNLQADLVRIETQLASASDPVVKREYEESREAVQKRLGALNAIGIQSDRIEAQLSSTAASLSGVQAELVRLHALGPDLASQLVPAQLRILRELSSQLTRFEQEVSQLSV